jgi:hypothetical protein
MKYGELNFEMGSSSFAEASLLGSINNIKVFQFIPLNSVQMITE